MIKVIIFDCIGVLAGRDGLNDQLFEYISGLSQKTAVLSNFDTYGYERVIPAHRRELFDETFLSGATGYSKPDPQSFINVCRVFDVLPEECVFVDDIASNVDAAARIGMESVIYTSLDELKVYLERLIGDN